MITVYDDAGATISAAAALTKAQAEAPTDFFGINQDVVPDVRRIAPHAFEVRINYRFRQLTTLKRPVPGETSTVRYISPPCYTKPKVMHKFLAAATVYGAGSTNVSANFPELQWGIDLPSGPQFLVQTPGHTFEPEAISDAYHYYVPNASVTRSYIYTVREMVHNGAWNNAAFMGCAAGTVQIVSFSAQERSPNDWDLEFGFGYRPKLTSVQVAPDITLPEVYGYQYWYERFKILPITVGGQIVQTIQSTEHVIIGQVWPTDDFSKLSLANPANITIS